MGRSPDTSPPERVPHACRPFTQGLAATANAALTSQTTVCWTTTADWRANQAGEPRYRFSVNRPDRYLWMTLDSSVW